MKTNSAPEEFSMQQKSRGKTKAFPSVFPRLFFPFFRSYGLPGSPDSMFLTAYNIYLNSSGPRPSFSFASAARSATSVTSL